MKKLFITILLLITYLGSIIANDSFYIKYNDDSIVYYRANYKETLFRPMGIYSNMQRAKVTDCSVLDESIKHSREDYDRIVEEIKSAHPEVFDEYKCASDGQAIYFKRGYFKDISKG